MKVLVTGATGFVGKKLAIELVKRGHTVSILTRDRQSARKRMPVECGIYQWEPELYPPTSDCFEGVDAVIHLAGANQRHLAGGRARWLRTAPGAATRWVGGGGGAGVTRAGRGGGAGVHGGACQFARRGVPQHSGR